MKILVTGGAGFIASHLIDLILKDDPTHQIIALDSLIDGHLENIMPHINSGQVEFLKGDIRNKDLILKQLDAVDMIFHLAADPDVRSSVPNPMSSYDHNMNGTMNILEYMRKYGITQMIFTSSGGTVYGEVDSFPITEGTLLNPISPYGASKAAAEMYLSAYANAYGMKIASVRFANIFGERSRHGVGFDFFNKLRKDPSKLSILGDGTQQKSYMHVEDCVKATLLVGKNLDNQEKPYDYYNVGSEEWYTVDEIARIYQKEMGLADVKHEYSGGKRGWTGDVAKMLLSLDKIKSLGFIEKINYQEGVKRYVNWLNVFTKEN